MPKLVEYVNPHPYTVQINGPNKEIIRVAKFSKVVLSDWFIHRCTPKFLRVVRILSEEGSPVPAPGMVQPPVTNVKPLGGKKQPIVRRHRPITTNSGKFLGVRSGRKGRTRRRDKIVGKALAHATDIYVQAAQEVNIAISDNIGVGILSYNRLGSLQRLINSIRRFTDLSRTTVFVSDDASDHAVTDWLSHQSDIVTIINKERLGISGNTNRLLRCLGRFKYKILLNDDVEILSTGWERFYPEAIKKSGYHHFCYRQPGLYGASQDDGQPSNVSNVPIRTIYEKPHGAVMAFNNTIFDRIGYFDESLVQYGMEHVDWSNRAGISKLQPPGFHDVEGSSRFFKIYREKSALLSKGRFLRENRAKYAGMKDNQNRLYVSPTARSVVPTMSIIIPIRDIGRSESIRTVLNNIRAQRFPEIEMILVEQDYERKFTIDTSLPIKHIFVKSKNSAQEFNKSRAFNYAVMQAQNDMIILHDADIIVQADYAKQVAHILRDFEGCHVGSRVMYLDPPSTASLCHSNKLDTKATCERAVGYFEGGSIAFHKRAYYKIGGFNEAYEGYGVEDCDFFERLRDYTKFFNQRSIDMFHLWHARVPGWTEKHRTNKKLAENIKKMMKGVSYIEQLKTQMLAKYPESGKYYE